MSLALALYLTNVIGSISFVLTVIWLSVGVGLALLGILYVFQKADDYTDENADKVKHMLKRLLKPFAILTVVAVLFPSSETAKQILVVSVAEDVVTSEEMTATARKSMEAFNKILDSYIEESE